MTTKNTQFMNNNTQDPQDNDINTQKEPDAPKSSESEKSFDWNEKKNDVEASKEKLMKITRGKSLQLIIDGYFIPSWNEKGGRNRKLVDEISKPRDV